MSHSERLSLHPWLQFIAGMALYAVLVIIQSIVLEPGRWSPVVMVPIAILPMIPAVWGMAGVVAAVRSMDELQRKIHVEASLYALGATAILTFGYGFLEVYAEFPMVSMFWVWPIIALAYGVGQALTRRAYR